MQRLRSGLQFFQRLVGQRQCLHLGLAACHSGLPGLGAFALLLQRCQLHVQLRCGAQFGLQCGSAAGLLQRGPRCGIGLRRLPVARLPGLQFGLCRGPFFLGRLQRLRALGQRAFFALQRLQLGAPGMGLGSGLRQRGILRGLFVGQALGILPARAGLRQLLLQRLPRAVGFFASVRAAQCGQPVHAHLVGGNVALQNLQSRVQLAALLQCRLQRAARGAGGGRQQGIALQFDRAHHRITAAGSQVTQRCTQRIAQVVTGVAHHLVHFVRAALANPQQARNAHVLGRAGAPPRQLETQQLGQVVFGRVPVQRLVAHLQLAALFA